ncbi:MAG: hypothetical protein PVI92_06610 [Chromatiales bacterium]|jgi:hypothetical protein
MKRPFTLLLIVLTLAVPAVSAFEFSSRLSLLGSVARAGPGELGYVDGADEILTADQQSARLMLDGGAQEDEWSLHLKAARVHLNGYTLDVSPATLFRYRDLTGEWHEERSGDSATRIGYELDRGLYKHHFETMTLALGRQPIDWGSGRFWQPLNVFGAFAPTDLDTDYKPGIDAVSLAGYPSPFSAMTAVFVPKSDEYSVAAEQSSAIHYRGQVGERSELSLLGGRILGNRVLGGAFESAWGGMGWRVEGSHYTLKADHEQFLFWIAGVDYQFDNGTLIAAEWHHNGHGATTQEALAGIVYDPLVSTGLQQQLGETLLGLMLERDITPLLHGGYTLLIGALKDQRNHLASSLLHQFTLVYSLSNESDLLCSLLTTSGKGLNSTGEVQSEFGHVPISITLRVRFYY